MSTLGERIYNNRKQKRYAQDEFGRIFDVTAQAVSKWERDLSEPCLEDLKKMAIFFEIPLIELLLSEDELEREKKRNRKRKEKTFYEKINF